MSIAIPDTSAIESTVVNLSDSFVQFRITNDSDLQKAKDGIEACLDLSKHPTIKDLSEACSDADKLHKRLVALRNKVLVPLQTLDKYIRGEIASYLAAQERQRLDLLKKLQEAEDAKHKAAEIELPPWEEVAAPTPNKIALAPAPKVVSGISLRRLPSRVEVVDFKKLVQAAAKDDSLLEFLSPNLPALTAKGRDWGKKITEERIPGVIVVDDEKTVSRR